MRRRRIRSSSIVAVVAVAGSLLGTVTTAGTAAGAAAPNAQQVAAAPNAQDANTWGTGSVISDGGTRVETPVRSSSPVTSVVETAVSAYAPLPASVGDHPAACDWLSYLRYRDAAGPTDPEQAAKVLIAQPGAEAGAGSLDGIARDTIVDAAARGSHIEFWALDRRSNCLEDNAGVEAGLAARDPHVAVEYYYRGLRVDGRTFAGFQNNNQVAWLADIGVQQTVDDEYTVLTHELPDQAYRARDVYLGGHSLGGVITAYFADSDFGGTPGSSLCAGYFALDTLVSTEFGAEASTEAPDPTAGALDGLGIGAVVAALHAGLVPRAADLPAVINPETTTLLAIAGLAANLDPTGISDLISYIPTDFNLDSTFRILFSKDLPTFVTGNPSVKQFRFTNAAALGGLMDDNSAPISILQDSVGFFTGGKITDKEFPIPNDLPASLGLGGLKNALGAGHLAIPDDTRATYGWLNYNQLAGVDIPKDKHGQPFTSPQEEVTDIGELARSLSEGPLDFTEHYFPTRLLLDTAIGANDPASVDPEVKFLDGVKAHPTETILGGDGLVVGGQGVPSDAVVLPGYQHLDVITAAPVQNDGRPEQGALHLAAFVTG